MNIYEIVDSIFPYVIFGYGAIVTVIMHFPFLMELGRKRIPDETLRRMQSHAHLAQICLWVGGLWILQTIWLTS